MRTIANREGVVLLSFSEVNSIYFLSHLPGEKLREGEDLAAAVNAAASEQNYGAE